MEEIQDYALLQWFPGTRTIYPGGVRRPTGNGFCGFPASSRRDPSEQGLGSYHLYRRQRRQRRHGQPYDQRPDEGLPGGRPGRLPGLLPQRPQRGGHLPVQRFFLRRRIRHPAKDIGPPGRSADRIQRQRQFPQYSPGLRDRPGNGHDRHRLRRPGRGQDEGPVPHLPAGPHL